MFEIKDNKVFMDLIHGYISVPKCFVQNIIDTEMYQRLRNVDQTGMRILYPDAKHDRFGHCLGVYYLGCKAVDALLDNFSKDTYWNICSNNRKILFWAKNKILFLIACLLHDIGHTPFSHSLEEMVLTGRQGSGSTLDFKQELINLISNMEKNSEIIEMKDINAAPHEQMGARYILEHMKKNLEAVYDDLIKENFPGGEVNSFLFSENYDGKLVLEKGNLDEDLCFIARMILGLKYKGYEPEKQIRNCFVELLNNDNFDVDKLDYILRDTHMSGIANVNVDVERLLGSITIVTKTVYKEINNFKEKFCGQTIYELSCLNKLFSEKQEHNLHLKGQYKVSIILYPDTEVKIKRGSDYEKLKSRESDGKIIVHKDLYFSDSTDLYVDGKQELANESKKGLYWKGGSEQSCFIKNAHIEEKNFEFTIASNSEFELWVNGECDIQLKGKFNSNGVINILDELEISGELDNLIMIGNNLTERIPDKNIYNEFSVGYKKQAMNVIANVLKARDYLYLWVYAHHKVVYYANYLLPILSNIVFEERKDWALEYKSLEYLDDFYVWTQIKDAYINVLENEEKELCQELFSRCYKKSLYKSLAEYDLVFKKFSTEEKVEIKNWLLSNLCEERTTLDINGKKTGGYLKENILKQLHKCGEENGYTDVKYIKDIVYVEASYKAKPINPHKTLIHMGNKVIAMEEIPLLNDKGSISNKAKHYFYLYYTVDDMCQEKEKLVIDLKKTICLFLEKNVFLEEKLN